MDLDQRMTKVEKCQQVMQQEFSEVCKQVKEMAERHEQSDKMQKELLEALCNYQRESTTYQKETNKQLKEMSEMFVAWNNVKGAWYTAKFVSAMVRVVGPILIGAGALWYAIKNGVKFW